MAKVLVIVSIYPSSVDIDLEGLVSKIKSSLPRDYELTRYEKVPIAFGLTALRAYFIIPEESEGGTSRLEEILGSIDGVGEFEVETVHRLSSY